MTQDNNRNWFASGGDGYARYRPSYPDALATFLSSIAPDQKCAVDVGCGNGQFTRQLAPHFDRVIGIDPSADQIGHAVAYDRVRYVVAPAEDMGLPDGSASLITAAQAAHWFDRPRFYAEARRIAMPEAVLALISYGIPRFDPVIDARFQLFYREEIGAYWPAERKLVESGYADIDFPFSEIEGPAMDIERAWDLSALMGYISTWSALRRVEEAGEMAMVDRFADDLAALWGDPAATHCVRWPVTLRLGWL